jgi:hypothetical protein
MLNYSNASDIVIPTVWQGFAAKELKGTVQLDWSVTTPGNVKSFVVEKSADNRNFVAVGIVPPQTEINEYHFTDSLPYSPETFYRIKQVDNDNNYAYSVIRKILATQSYGSTMQAFPNPFTEKIYLMMPSVAFQPIYVKISDAQGRLMQAAKFDYTGNAVVVQNMGAYSRGLYFITVTGSKGKTLFIQKLLKK